MMLGGWRFRLYATETRLLFLMLGKHGLTGYVHSKSLQFLSDLKLPYRKPFLQQSLEEIP